MTGSLIFWVSLALLLFWAVGAYNRLVRLRAQANAAFATLDSHWQGQLALIRTAMPASMTFAETVPPGVPMDESVKLWATLFGAASQFQSCLAASRARPLEAPTTQALAEAQAVLEMAWQRVQLDANDLAGASMPDTMTQQWRALSHDTAKSQEIFNLTVTDYNAAISQFPASLLARVFSFEPAEILGN